MNTPLSMRLRLAALALLAEAAHLAWEALHGGIVTHHVLQRADLPGISNAWGLLVLPALGAWTAGRWPAWRDARWKVALGLLLPLVMGAALAVAFQLRWQAGTEALFFSLLLAAAVLPAHRPESLLGFVLGMSWTFGAVIPLVIGGLLALISWLVRGLARWAWRFVGRASA